jgi:hypothetical protein
VVARSYALDLALVPLLAALYEDRSRRPLSYGLALGLLANTNAHGFVIALPLGLDFALTGLRRPAGWRSLGGVALCVLLGVAAGLQAIPPHDPDFQSAGGFDIKPARALALLLEGLINRGNPLDWGNDSIHITLTGAALTGLVLAAAATLAAKARRLALCAGMMLAITSFYGLVYNNYWHSGLVFLVLLFALWISWRALPQVSAGSRRFILYTCAALLAYQGVYTAGAWAQDLTQPYSSSRSASMRIAQIVHDHPDQPIAAAGFKTFSILPMLPQAHFANMGPHPRRFYRWNRRVGPTLYPMPADWAAMSRAPSYDWLLLSADNVRHTFQAAGYVATARRGGFCLSQTFPGRLIWKTRTIEPDALLLFHRCSSAG